MDFNEQAARSFHCPRWNELPGIPLYMDQVVFVLDAALGPFAAERAVTPTMINNYVKQKLIPPPEKKKYKKDHLAMLMVVSVLKRVFSMEEIMGLMDKMIGEFGDEAAYDLFCERLEQSVHTLPERQAQSTGPDAASALDAALSALSGKLLVQSYLAEAD